MRLRSAFRALALNLPVSYDFVFRCTSIMMLIVFASAQDEGGHAVVVHYINYSFRGTEDFKRHCYDVNCQRNIKKTELDLNLLQEPKLPIFMPKMVTIVQYRVYYGFVR